MRGIASIWAVVMLAGCAAQQPQMVRPTGHYPSYQEFLAVGYARDVDAGPSSGAPGQVKLAYGECASTFVMSHATPEQRARLDAFARGETLMTTEEWKAIAADLIAKSGGPLTYDSLGRLSGTCPADVAVFKREFRPGFNGQ